MHLGSNHVQILHVCNTVLDSLFKALSTKALLLITSLWQRQHLFKIEAKADVQPSCRLLIPLPGLLCPRDHSNRRTDRSPPLLQLRYIERLQQSKKWSEITDAADVECLTNGGIIDTK